MQKASEMATKWNCSKSTVIRWCISGIIPPAEQTGKMRTWMIPDDWPKPPMTRHQLCFLLDTVDQTHLGVKFSDLEMGYSDEELQAGYRYLITSGFITSFDSSDLVNQLENAYVTTRGAALIESDNAATKTSIKFTARAKAFTSLGIASVEADCEVSNER